ncbi:hypothetical protein MTR67_009339 [Solanum verrucosum]|uniref:Uncharacterized protein n=1 Tax=Solanum verrucosum TaxID=315347 RepID=A0AAF0TER1_SOLVR|nr:hypothetical protein MTR67_009339 [Solanum verrucosum]
MKDLEQKQTAYLLYPRPDGCRFRDLTDIWEVKNSSFS